MVAFLLLLTVSLSQRSYTSLFQHVKLCMTIFLPMKLAMRNFTENSKICNEVLISLIILLQVLLSSWCSARKVQLCFLRDLAFHLQNCRIQQKLHETHKICLWLERIRSLHLKKFNYLLSKALSTNDITNIWSLLWLRY